MSAADPIVDLAEHPLAAAVQAVEDVAASAPDPAHTVDDLAALMRAVEDLKKRCDLALDELAEAALPHVKYGHPVPTPYGRLRRASKGAKDVWDHKDTAHVVAARALGDDILTDDVTTVLDEVLAVASISWRKEDLRARGIEPNEEPYEPVDGVDYLGLCSRRPGRPTVKFETTRTPTADCFPEEVPIP
jgi:hypothetical protein